MDYINCIILFIFLIKVWYLKIRTELFKPITGVTRFPPDRFHGFIIKLYFSFKQNNSKVLKYNKLSRDILGKINIYIQEFI